MTNQSEVLRAKLARLKAAKKKSDGAALGRDGLKEAGRDEGKAARSAEEAAKAARRGAKRR